MKNSIKVLSVFIAFVVIFASSTFYSSARTIEDIEAEIAKNEEELERLANEKNKKEDYIEALQKQNKALDAQISEIEKQLAPIQEKIDELDGEIKELETEISLLGTEIDSLDIQIADQKVEIEKTYELLSKRLRATYMAGETSELEIFLGATDFQDFLNRTELVRQISKHDTDVVNTLEDQIDGLNKMVNELTQKRDMLNVVRQQLETDKAEREQEKSVLDEQLEKKEQVIKQNEANIKKQNEVIGSLNQESAYVKKLIEQARVEKEEASKELDKDISNSGSSGSGTVTGSTEHGFKLSSKGTICPIQESGVKYSADFASHSSRGTASVDLVSYQNRVINGKTYWTTKGAKVYAMADGTVTKSTYVSSTYGNYINIDHGNGLSTLYAHMDARYYQVGDKVKQGDVIGIVGNTGNCWPRPTAANPAAGSHLHLEVRVNGNRVNPEPYLPISK